MADGTVKILTDLSTESFKKGLSKMGSIAKAGLSAVTTSVTAVSAALGGVGAYAVKVGSDFETAFAQVQTIMDSTVVSYEDMEAGLSSLSSQMGISFTELADTAYNAISATGDTAGALDMTEASAKLATAGFTDTSSALSTLTTVMNAYGYTAKDATAISDSLISVQNLGVTTIDQLSSSMGKAIATASAYGVDLNNLESSYVSLTKAGISTEESTTYLASMFKELGDSGSEVSEILQKETGKSFGQLMESGMSLGDVLGILQESVDGDSEALMNLWGSAEAGKAANAIVSQGLTKFNDNLETIANSAGATENAYEIMCDTLSHKTEVFKTTLQGLGSSIYDSIQEPLKNAVQLGTGYLNDLQAAFDSGGISGAVSALGSVFADVITQIASAAPQMIDTAVSLIDNFISGISGSLPQLAESAVQIGESLLTAFLDIFPQIISMGSQLVVDFAQGAVQALPTLTEKGVEMIQTICAAVTSALPQLITAAQEAIPILMSGLAEAIPALLDAGIQIIAQLVSGIAQALPELIPAAVDIIMSLVQSLVDNLPMLLDAALQLIDGLAKGIIKAIPRLIKALPKLIQGIVDFIVQGIPMIIDAAIQLINGLVAALPEIISALIEALPQIIESLVSGLISCIGQLVAGAIQLVVALVTHIPEIIAGLIAAIPEIIVAIIDGIINGLGSFVEAGGQIIDALWQGIKDMWDSLVKWFTEVIPNLITQIWTCFSELPGKVGEWLTATLNNVISWGTTLWNKAVQIGSDFVNGVVNFIKTLPQNVWNWLKNVVSKVVSFASEFVKNAKKAGQDFFNGLVNKVKEIPRQMLDIGKNIVSGIWNGISGAASWLWDQISGFCSGIVNNIKGFFGIHSPSRLMAEEIGRYLPPGITEGFKEALPEAERQMESGLDALVNDLTPPVIPIDIMAQIRDSGVLDHIPVALDVSQASITARARSNASTDKPAPPPEPIDYNKLASAMSNVQLTPVVEMDGKKVSKETTPHTDQNMGTRLALERRYA